MAKTQTSKREQPYSKKLDLSGLFDLAESPSVQESDISQSPSGSMLSIDVIQCQPEQVRRYFDPQKMEDLIKSIKTYGILENLVVRPLPDGQYQLVAGERRYRAARALGLTEVPVLILDLSDLEARQIALIENLQREELNPVEETEGVLQLLSIQLELEKQDVVSLLYKLQNARTRKVNHNVMVQEQQAVVEEIFTKLGRWSWHSFVKNRLPLLSLPPDILEALERGEIAYTKAMALKTVKDDALRNELLQQAIAENLSLSQIKARIKQGQLNEAEEASPSSQLQTTYQRLQKAKLWQQDPKKWQKVNSLLQKIDALLTEE
jgi:ParB family transcriptional regulator, chromosome partitioning protein